MCRKCCPLSRYCNVRLPKRWLLEQQLTSGKLCTQGEDGKCRVDNKNRVSEVAKRIYGDEGNFATLNIMIEGLGKL